MQAQMVDERPKSAFYPTIGIGLGFFNPQEVNAYIENDIDSKGYTGTYNTTLYSYFEIKGGLTYRLRRFDVNGSLECGFGPKYIMIANGGENLSYNFGRVAPTISTNYYIPLGMGRHALSIGGGVHYNYLKFKEYSATTPGYKIQVGSSLQMGKFNLQPYLAYNNVMASDKSTLAGIPFDMDYTGVQIGIVCSVHKIIYFK